MIAYKAFNKNLQATMGRGIFQFEAGKTYEEKECKCAKNGFHCAENPLCTLDYYSGMDTRFFIVEASGDINQDGNGSRISCTELTLKKEISRVTLAMLGIDYMQQYPERETESRYVAADRGSCHIPGDFLIVRGKDPAVAGEMHTFLFLAKEEKKSREIESVCRIFIDGKKYKPGTYYHIRGEQICRKRN